MQTLDSAVDCSSPIEDDSAPPPSVPLVVDVLDRDQDDVGTESSCRMMTYDELHEILSWMPAKAAIKYSSSLCKWLCNIHSEPRFIKKQCIRSCGQDNSFFLQLMHREFHEVSNEIEFHLLPWETRSAFGFPYQSLDNLPNYGRLLSSSNGLVLVGDEVCDPFGEDYRFWLCNPVTREWAALPTPERFTFLVNEYFTPLIECSPLDDVEFPNDYTIALPIQAQPLHLLGRRGKNNKQELAIYSNGKWEEELCDVSIKGRSVRYEMPVGIFSNATKGLIVHYLCENSGLLEPYIAVFDLREKRLLREIKLPEGASVDPRRHEKLWIYKWKETSICLVSWSVVCRWIKVWVLDDYGCKDETWREVKHEFDYDTDPAMGVGVANGKGLLIARGTRIYVCGLDGEQQGELELLGEHHLGFGIVKFIPYANTLRPVCVANSKTFDY